MTIEVTGLAKSYGKKRVVDDLSFAVRPGTVTGFLGPNGAGKSTTLRILLGLARPDTGTALIAGRAYHEHPEPLHMIGALMDARWAHPNRAARAHLSWLAHTNRIPAHRVDEVLDQVGLTPVAKQHVGGFSLGMAQRLGLATALLGDPSVLVLDEPANGLDPEGIAWLRGLLRALAAEGRTVFVSSHLLAEMAQLADEVVMIGRGKLLAQGPITDLTSDASTDEVMVRTPHAAKLHALAAQYGATIAEAPAVAETFVVTGISSDAIGKAAADMGIVLYELTPRRRTVEEAYLRLTAESVEYRGNTRLIQGSQA
ncbi:MULTISPECIES: ATP-binding cassette domain-containing protein [unclassified Streptomyces]|uniref:ATP-binding cassette domain-containing protein n=1 Tax=unclassified Streptomyces TaxID=2593676 RepID=UPI003805EA6D